MTTAMGAAQGLTRALSTRRLPRCGSSDAPLDGATTRRGRRWRGHSGTRRGRKEGPERRPPARAGVPRQARRDPVHLRGRQPPRPVPRAAPEVALAVLARDPDGIRRLGRREPQLDAALQHGPQLLLREPAARRGRALRPRSGRHCATNAYHPSRQRVDSQFQCLQGRLVKIVPSADSRNRPRPGPAGARLGALGRPWGWF